MTPSRPIVMGLGGVWDPHLWGWGSHDPSQTHTYGAGGHVTPSRPIVMGLGVMGARPDPHLWGWGHATPARPTLMGLGVMGPHPDP